MHLMGFLGGLCIMGSLFFGAFASWSLIKAAQIWGYSMAISNATPAFVLSAELLIMGLQVSLTNCTIIFLVAVSHLCI